MRIRRLAATAAAVAAVAVLSACSLSTDATTSSPAASSPAASASAQPTGEQSSGAQAGTAEMTALCTQMVDEKMTPEDATALAEKNGYVARVGTIDGQPQAVTMDLRDDRFTFDVEGGVVVGCTYG
ncbi:MAG: hypothetical protein U0R65_08145 [Candidatus Nanopelagicales bacterium]|jgi:hypothetical protein